MIDLEMEWPPISTKRLAKALGVHTRTVEKYYKAGLEHVRIGGRYYTTKAAVARFAESPEMAPGRRERIDREAHLAAERYLDSVGLCDDKLAKRTRRSKSEVQRQREVSAELDRLGV